VVVVISVIGIRSWFTHFFFFIIFFWVGLIFFRAIALALLEGLPTFDP